MATAIMLAGCGSQQSATISPPSTEPPSREAFEENRSTAPVAVPTTTTTMVPDVDCVSPFSTDELEDPPPSAVEGVQLAAADPAFGTDVSISIWVDGWGELVAVNPDRQLVPASNQKLLVAIAAHDQLDMTARFRTTLELIDSGLVFRAGGDPTLTTSDVDDLVRQAVANGVTSADGLTIDIAGYRQPPVAPGWLDWQIPTFVGPLSGLMIDNNRWSQDELFLADPARGNGERIIERMVAGGIAVPEVIAVSDVELTNARTGRVVAEHESAPFDDLVRSMLLSSDNQTADLLLMELGRNASGDGTLSAGADVVDAVMDELCVGASGTVDDGSGLSRGNERSAREFQEILRAVRGTPAGELMHAQLPVSGVSGTMVNRFGGSDAGRVAAKTGTIKDGRSLSGYTTTDSGRDVVFSIIVNGEPELARASLGAIDRLVTAVLRISE